MDLPINAKSHTGEQRGSKQEVQQNAILAFPKRWNGGEVNWRLNIFSGVRRFRSHVAVITATVKRGVEESSRVTDDVLQSCDRLGDLQHTYIYTMRHRRRERLGLETCHEPRLQRKTPISP